MGTESDDQLAVAGTKAIRAGPSAAAQKFDTVDLRKSLAEEASDLARFGDESRHQ
jgi:hypothetical protein